MEIKLVRYEKLSDLIDEYCQGDLKDIKTLKKAVSGCECWGFIEDKKIIHCWFSEKATIPDLIHLIGHELGHIRFGNEDDCDFIGWVAALSGEMVCSLIEGVSLDSKS